MEVLRKAMRFGSVAVILAALLGAASLGSAIAQTVYKKPVVAAKPAAKAPAKPTARQGAGGGIAANRGATRGPSTNGTGSRGPTANGGSMRQGQPAPAQYAAAAPPKDPNVGSEVAQVGQQGDQSETDVQSEAAQDNGAPAGAAQAVPAVPAATATVELGQTPDHVQAALGAPARVASLGAKVIYYYNGMKVIFNNGKVSDVQ